MRNLLWTAPVFLLSLVSACTLGPDFNPPDISVPAAWSESLEGGEQAGTPQIAQWWIAFSDPVLDSLVEQAIASNFDLRMAESRIREARASLQMTGARQWPQINTSGSYTRTQSVKTPATNAASGRVSTTFSPNGLAGVGLTAVSPIGPSLSFSPDLSGNGNSTVTLAAGTEGIRQSPSRQTDLYQAGFDASWELDIFGGIRREREAARAELEASEESRRAIQVTLIAEIARNYFELRETQIHLDIAQRNIRLLQESLDLVQSRFDAGLTNELDVKTAEALLATTHSFVPTLESNMTRSIHRLGVLLGLEPAALKSELSAAASLPVAPPEVLVGLPSDLLRRRPDVRYAERSLAAATARIGVATADLFPKFSLTGSFIGADNALEGIQLNSNQTWSIGPSVRWPLFDAGRIRANINIQNARQEQSLIAYEKAVMTALEEVENALVSYAKEQNRLVALETAVEANRKALDIANELYTQGLVNFLHVLDAERSLFSSEDQRIQCKSSVLKNLVSLYKALGGGWDASLPQSEWPEDNANAGRLDALNEQSN